MNNRLFWIRSAPPPAPDPAGPEITIQTLKSNYPGFMGAISAYTAILRAGISPHEMHTHREEEQIVVVSGELEATVEDETHRLGPGGFCHIPSGLPHEVRSAGSLPTEFLVFKWNWEGPSASRATAVPIFFTGKALVARNEQPGIQRHRICQDNALANGATLTAEFIQIAAHSGYPDHAHDHDLMLILLRGQLHGLHPAASAPAIIYYPAKTPHMMAPLHSEPTEMIALEFHRGD
jgi:quercetin dioxygenase-like cupin family protein